jgi:hypothetical protein
VEPLLLKTGLVTILYMAKQKINLKKLMTCMPAKISKTADGGYVKLVSKRKVLVLHFSTLSN